MSQATAHEISIELGRVMLGGSLAVPDQAHGLVIFAHGSGSSRHSPRNIFVADALHQFRCATLLMDLLTERESADRRNVFDIDLLGHRVVEVTRWAKGNLDLHTASLKLATASRLRRPQASSLPVAYFGASTGAAAALVAAAELVHQIKAVVSRGGRPDLAGAALPRITAPTLLLVGSLDEQVLDLNRQAQARMSAADETKLVVIPGASHLFEEPGTLEQVAQSAGEWIARWFGSADERR